MGCSTRCCGMYVILVCCGMLGREPARGVIHAVVHGCPIVPCSVAVAVVGSGRMIVVYDRGYRIVTHADVVVDLCGLHVVLIFYSFEWAVKTEVNP